MEGTGDDAKEATSLKAHPGMGDDLYKLEPWSSPHDLQASPQVEDSSLGISVGLCLLNSPQCFYKLRE